jgi:hypothetical protein
LTILRLDYTPIGDADIPALKAYPKLEDLYLNGTTVTAAGVAALADLPSLRLLNLSDVKLTEDGYRAIGRCAGVTELTLNSCPLEPGWVAHLGGAKSLKNLSLAYVKGFDDATAAALAVALPGLEDLTANYTGLTGAGLEKLAPLSKLKTVSAIGSKVTKADAEKFQKEHPGVKVYGN